jgi:hypothetical protein
MRCPDSGKKTSILKLSEDSRTKLGCDFVYGTASALHIWDRISLHFYEVWSLVSGLIGGRQCAVDAAFKIDRIQQVIFHLSSISRWMGSGMLPERNSIRRCLDNCQGIAAMVARKILPFSCVQDHICGQCVLLL